MSDERCEDCLYYGTKFKWQDDDYCNKKQCHVDGDNRACSSFLDDSHDCCYDCDNGKDRALTFWCSALKKTIDNPGSYYCYHFRD